MPIPLKPFEAVQDEYVEQVLAASDREILEGEEIVELRVVACDTCGGDGGWLDEVCTQYGRVIYQKIECRACGGTGEIEVEFRSIRLRRSGSAMDPGLGGKLCFTLRKSPR